jgi:hypothetical protein
MNTQNKFIGTGVAITTPFNTDLSIDSPSLEKHIEHLISNGINYLIVLGTTGEAVTLFDSEKEELITFIKEKVNNRIPIVLGLGGNNTQAILNKINETDFNGIDAILSVAPYYNKPTQEGIYQHFKAISETCPIPIILYNVPGRTASNIFISLFNAGNLVFCASFSSNSIIASLNLITYGRNFSPNDAVKLSNLISSASIALFCPAIPLNPFSIAFSVAPAEFSIAFLNSS